MNNETRKALSNVTRYDDIKEYGEYNAGATMEDLKELIDDGWVAELTPGTYNGSIDKFERVTELTDNDIINAIKADMIDDNLIEDMLETVYSDDNTADMQVLDYTGIYNVFTIGQRLYVDMD